MCALFVGEKYQHIRRVYRENMGLMILSENDIAEQCGAEIHQSQRTKKYTQRENVQKVAGTSYKMNWYR
jgi:hypothetical protein